jgi:hypothetical protein
MSAAQMDELFHRMVWSSIGVSPPSQTEQAKLSKRFVKI